jgi:DHA2 family multidrug resistance protein-like MFS transporter
VGRAEDSLAGALQAAAELGGTDGARVTDIAREAFVAGMHGAAIIAGCVALVAAGIVYRKLPGGNPHQTGAADVTGRSAGAVADVSGN